MSVLWKGCGVASVAGLVALCLVAPLALEGRQETDQAPPQEELLSEKAREERRKRIASDEVQPLVGMIDAAIAGTAESQAGFSVEWSNDVFHAQSGQTYVPYSLLVPQADLEAEDLVVYLRLVRRGASPTLESATPGEAATAAVSPPPTIDMEDAYFVRARKPLDPLEPYRFSRALVIDSGDYDVYVAMAEQTEEAPAKASVLTHALSVPDLSTALATSSLFLNPRLTQLADPLGWEEQETRPYALGSVELGPAWTQKLAKSDTLSLFLFIYNAQLSPETGKPDVVVDYNFYTVSATGERFFNKTNPQAYNAQTMPPQWDASLGHQLNVGLNGVPLTSFPLGSYRLEVKVTDKMSGASLARDVTFELTPGT